MGIYSQQKTKSLNIWYLYHTTMVKRRTISITFLNLNIVNELFTHKKGLTIKNLADNIKTDYKNTYNAINFLFKNGIIKKEKIGNYNLCKLNYNHDEIINYLKLHNSIIKTNDFKRKYNVEYQIIKDAINLLKSEIGPFFICLVFGSYAKNEEKKESDIDILFLTFSSKADVIIKKILNKLNAPYLKKFHPIEQDIESFKKDLRNKDKLSIATEIYKEPPIVFYGEDIFFKMLIEDIN